MNILTSSEKRKCVLCGRVTTVSLLFCRSGIEIRIPVCEKHQKDASFNLEGGLKHITDTIRHTFFLQASADMTRRKYPNIKEKKGAKMELNREQIRYKMSEKHIIRALECLSKPNSSPVDREKCYFMWKEPSCLSCYHEVAQNALDLIKELTEENERLRAENDELCDNIACLEIDKENAERRTARIMQKTLTDFFANDAELEYIEVDAEYINGKIDQIAKEMLEGEK